jgi:hypothetical protein
MAEPSQQQAEQRVRALDARILGKRVRFAPADRRQIADWLAEVVPPGADAPLGVAEADVPVAWRDVLAWSGVPFSADGPLRWGPDLRQDDVAVPTLRDGSLLLPPPTVLAELTSLSLKPLRRLVAERLGCRLQAAPGIRLWLWPGRAVLQSLSQIPLAGFLYGSAPGHRSSVALEPYGHQVITW